LAPALAYNLEEFILIFTGTRNRRPPNCCLSGKAKDILRGIARQHDETPSYSAKWAQALHSFRLKLYTNLCIAWAAEITLRRQPILQ